jgi:exodeoxyribonuclease VII large subunit
MTTETPWRVGELLTAAGDVLTTLGPGPCWVSGTLSGWRTSRAYAWGELLEHSPDGRTQLARLPIAVPWGVARDGQRAIERTGFALGDGIDLTVHGRFEINERYGPLRFLVDDIAPTAVPGAAKEARQRLVAQLDGEDLLRRNAQQPLPDRIDRVGLVAAATGGAGRADFVGRLVAAGGPFQVVEQRAVMQGPDAPVEIARAVNRLLGEGVDVIVVTRGGGAMSELAAFDSEPVARAIARASVPVIVAVGHSTDHSVADEVAHTSLTTPTAAAAWLLDRRTVHTPELPPSNQTQVEELLALAAREAAGRLALESSLRHHRLATVALAAAFIVVVVFLML